MALRTPSQIPTIVLMFFYLVLFISLCVIISENQQFSDDDNEEVHRGILPEFKPKKLEDIFQLETFLDTTTSRCLKPLEVGGAFNCIFLDGFKEVCFDPWFQPPANACLIYSFGVGDEITFEYAIGDTWECKIYVYDFSVDFTEVIQDPRITFKQWGLANSSYISENGDKFMTYKDTLASNGHNENTDVHFLKLDVEGTEYDILTDMIDQGFLKNVWQIHMELHDFRQNLTDVQFLQRMNREYAILRKFEDYGFTRVRSTTNIHREVALKEKPNCCRDVLWINERRIPKFK